MRKRTSTAPSRVAFIDVRTADGLFRFAFGPTPIGFEARVRKALPYPSPPALPGEFARDAKGGLLLVGGKAVALCDPEAGAHKAAIFEVDCLRTCLWLAKSMEAAGPHNAGLVEAGQEHLFGRPLELSEEFARHVLAELEAFGVSEGDFQRLIGGYMQAVGAVAEDLGDSSGNSPSAGSAS